ncbi:uncharacterized protein LOC116610670 isoform X2 [Nematostella vectensis]|nr:uncharacterized protein LOC116610670 isoform X2 [Nematostella vectensis]
MTGLHCLSGRKACRSIIAVLFITVIGAEEAPLPFASGVKSQHGVYIEKWEGVDTYDIKTLLKDSRFPNLPTWRGYGSAFTQPENWGENFGTRIRTYFVPQQSGSHIFYISANNQGQLFLSSDETAKHKSLIASVSGKRSTKPTEYYKYDEQKSWPAQLTKGKFYYMETLMSEYYSGDSLGVAVETPDGKFYAPIPSQFLWTAYSSSSAQFNSASQMNLMKVAARAGARAGANAGESAASRSGARAGAAAGAAAGAEGGAKAGAEAAAKAARRVMNKAINLALKAYSGPGEVINIHLNKYGVASKEAESQKGTSPSGGSSSGTGASSAGGSSAGASGGGHQGAGGGSAAGGGTGSGSTGNGNAGSGNAGNGGAGGGGAGGGSTGGASASGSKSSSSSASSQSGSSAALMSRRVPSEKPIFTAILPSGGTKEGMLHMGMAGNQNVAITPGATFVKMPNDGEDPDEIARKSVFLNGAAKEVVIGSKYTIHSLNIPAIQENATINQCFRSDESHLNMDTHCQYFIARRGLKMVPGRENSLLSFESACIQGYFIVQRNFRFFLGKKDGTDHFNKEATFVFHKIVAYPFSLMIMMIHHDLWFICESMKDRKHGVELILRYASEKKEFQQRCAFTFLPIPSEKSPTANCRNVIDVSTPSIPGHSKKNKGAETTNQTCVAIKFINKEFITFKLITDVNDKEYLVSEGVFKLRVIVKRPELHPQVLFKAEDPKEERRILLNGDKTIAVVPKQQCDDYLSVEVSSKKELAESPKEKPSVHYHYHYHPAQASSPSPAPPLPLQSACPAACQPASTCLPSCPAACCTV